MSNPFKDNDSSAQLAYEKDVFTFFENKNQAQDDILFDAFIETLAEYEAIERTSSNKIST